MVYSKNKTFYLIFLLMIKILILVDGIFEKNTNGRSNEEIIFYCLNDFDDNDDHFLWIKVR